MERIRGCLSKEVCVDPVQGATHELPQFGNTFAPTRPVPPSQFWRHGPAHPAMAARRLVRHLNLPCSRCGMRRIVNK
eukprot:357218-Chlamydomonas_euryale.AAC.18